ncbi:MAG: class I SAM-dependent methyltransferase [Azospirillum sp.]|nr:class I SAM-dependent methyltransferase [Azospirillum sp.]MCZ8124872.1 class I SAM-dependent methyltransferase [Magnetospirillum sp.]
MKLGDFTGLAANYTRYRQGYAPGVRAALIGLLPVRPEACAAVDVGAGTGIWTRMLAEAGFARVTAVEPNADMRGQGMAHPDNGAIVWREGSGAATGLPDRSAALVTMASSFHWVDFDAGMAEFARLLTPGGRFCALWNPRLVEANPLTAEIEAELDKRLGGQKRVSSGNSGITETLMDRLCARGDFDDIVYLEGRHAVAMPREAYLGAWWSVNDVRAKLGEAGFADFMAWVAARIADAPTIEAVYRTRAWAARRRA